jgi:hypothetical protein
MYRTDPMYVCTTYLIILRKIDVPAKSSVLPKPGPTNYEAPLSVGPTNCSMTVLPLCGKKCIFGFFGWIKACGIFHEMVHIENAKFCAESNGDGFFIENHCIPFEFNSPLLKFVA